MQDPAWKGEEMAKSIFGKNEYQELANVRRQSIFNPAHQTLSLIILSIMWVTLAHSSYKQIFL